MAAAKKGKSLPEDSHVELLLEDLDRLLAAKGVLLDDVFPAAGELSRIDYLNAHATLARCKPEGPKRTQQTAASFKRSLGLSNIPTPLGGRRGAPRKGDGSFLRKPRQTFGGMSPMEALLGVRHRDDMEIDPAVLGASRRGTRRLSMNPVDFHNPSRQDQMQCVYDFLKSNRGSPVMSRILGQPDAEARSSRPKAGARPKTAGAGGRGEGGIPLGGGRGAAGNLQPGSYMLLLGRFWSKNVSRQPF